MIILIMALRALKIMILGAQLCYSVGLLLIMAHSLAQVLHWH